jgi:1-deoxy-D-xylulose-5-phosphate synthase
MLADATAAARRLAESGVAATVYDVRSCIPLDEVMLDDAAAHGAVVTVEDGIRDGGIGDAIRTALAVRSQHRVEVLGVPTRFVPQATKPSEIHAQLGIDEAGIAAAATALVAANQ